MIKIVLIGDGGHSKVVQDIIDANRNFKLSAVLDSKYNEAFEIDKVTYDNVNAIQSYLNSSYSFCVAVGNNDIRKKLVQSCDIPARRYVSLIHPSAIISPSVKIDKGTVVMPNVVINAGSAIGKHTIINSNAVIEHDNIIGDYAHISPSATLAGRVNVDKGTHIGSNATVIPNVNIGSWSIIGAGAVVTKNLDKNITAVGVPAEPILKKGGI